MTTENNNRKGNGSNKSKAKKPSLLYRFWSLSWKLSLVIAAVAGAYSIYLDQMIGSKFEGQKWYLPAQIFSRSMALYPGAPVSHGQFIDELKLLGYRKVATPRQIGEFSASATRVELWRRPFLHPEGQLAAQQVMINFDDNGVASVQRMSDMRQLAIFHLEPVLLDRIVTGDGEDRLFVPTAEIPKTVVDGLILVEDRSFYEHYGINPLAIIRAAMVNLSAGRTVQGGSTLTQQLAKNFFLSSERSLIRKIREALMAVIIDFRYSKEEILEAYLNEVYMGQDRNRAIHGMGLASQFYFGRPVGELTLAQQALLVAEIKGPSFYNPWRYPERAQERRDLVLQMLFEGGKVTEQQYKVAVASSLALRNAERPVHQKLPAFFAQVKQELRQRYGDALLKQSGVRVYTTLDPLAQEAAEKAVEDTLQSLDSKNKGLQAGMVVTDRYTYGIAAMVGDRNPGYDGFNRAAEIRRPIGSLVKPFVYATALAHGEKFNLYTPLKDEPITLTNEQGKTWSPKNDDRQFSGQVPLITALSKSMNVPTVNIGMEVGLSAVATTLKQAGWSESVPAYPSMLLGAINGSPLMVVQAYQTLANSGRYRGLYAVTAVLDKDNQPLPVSTQEQSQVIEPTVDYLVQYAMTKVVQSGTAARLGVSFPGVTLAGKTGTSNDQRDSWFAGFDERNVAAIWVGRDDNGKTGLYGSNGAMAIYRNFLKERAPLSLRLTLPDGLIWGYFDPATGVAKEPDCYDVEAAPALPISYQPVENCGQELPWWRRMLGG